MILYHASNVIVEKPDVSHSRKRVDFGAGFYTTPLMEQARNWCMRYIRTSRSAYISKYIFDEEQMKNWNIRQFDSYSEEWLDFIVSCRAGNDNTDYDIVIGGVANDKVFDTVELFLQELIEKREALRRLKYNKPNVQICFRNQQVIESVLKYTGSEKI